MSVTPGFQDLYPGSETVRVSERAELEQLDTTNLVFALTHAVEVGEYLRAQAAQEVLGTRDTSPKIMSDSLTIPSSWFSKEE